ncbi:MAG: phage major capsid protein [Acidobacteriota bacterium]
MASRATELLRERAELITKAQELHQRAEAEHRDLNTEETAEFDRLMAAAEALKTRADRELRIGAMSAGLEEAFDTIAEPGRTVEQAADDGRPLESTVYQQAFRDYLTALDSVEAADAKRQAIAALPHAASDPLRVNDPKRGGSLLPPPGFIDGIIKGLRAALPIMGLIRLHRVSAQQAIVGTGRRKRISRSKTWQLGSELSEAINDESLRFGKRQLQGHPATAGIAYSNDLATASVIPVDQIIEEELTEEGEEFFESLLILHNGAGGPLGMLQPSEHGIPISRDVSDENEAAGVTYEGLVNAVFHVKPRYHRSSTWLFPTSTLKSLVKMRDDSGRPIWAPSIRDDEPDRLLGRPVVLHELMPGVVAPGQYVGLFGDFYRGYEALIADDWTFQRLFETGARRNQVEVIARTRIDGQPMLEDCWARIQLPEA